MPLMRPLVAGDLLLEPQVAAHADAMFVVLSDPRIYEHENAPPASVDALRERFRRLESRLSADGQELWLNWVIRLPGGDLAGFVQATVSPGGRAAIAYELASAHWGRGIAYHAVQAMIDELIDGFGVHTLYAVLKRDNRRSLRLLERLGFAATLPDEGVARAVEPGELLMHRAGRPA